MILEKLTVNASSSYDILFERSLTPLADFARDRGYEKIVVVTDENVDRFHGTSILSALANFSVLKVVLPAGESTKSFENLLFLYEKFAEFGLTRTDAVIAMGGGVIGDLTGFAAATFLRGVPYIQIPTSLLAQVDSSVGGKVAVNAPYGKNLIGNFYQPKFVLINTDFLKTLPQRNFRDGMAEVIKHAAIRDFSLWEQLLSRDYGIGEIVRANCAIKKSFVEADERDVGGRMMLNFGHTLGHAVETFGNYEQFTHGEAVAIGMYNITKIAEERGLSPVGTAAKILTMLDLYDLPHELPTPVGELLEPVLKDKKTAGGMLNLILLRKIGEAFIHKVPVGEIVDFFQN